MKIKTVEAMSNGLPLVTTSEGANGLEELNGKAFFIADEATDFASKLKKLITDENVRNSFSEFSLKYVEDYFSKEACFSDLKKHIDNHKLELKSNTSLKRNVDFSRITKERVLVIGVKDFPIFKGSPELFSCFPNSFFHSISQIKNEKDLSRILVNKRIDSVFFLNPYINEKSKRFYEYLIFQGVDTISFDRGALPDSWFLDRRGFNGESFSYDPRFWRKNLSSEQRQRVASYINNIFYKNVALEKQGNAIGANVLKQKLGLVDKKILFIPFQRPNDTVVRYMSKNVDGMSGFCSFVNALYEILPSDWAIIGKKHPLESTFPECNIKFVEEDTHVNDLIQMADASFMINSGVGVYSLMAGKPTFVCGKAFYCHEGLATEVGSPQELAEYLKLLPSPDTSKIQEFIHYLLNDFYSFGKAKGFLRLNSNGDYDPVTTGIEFYKINGV